MEILIGVAGEGKRLERAGLHSDPELLGEFPNERVFRAFSLNQFSAGKFPKSREVFAPGPLRDKNAIVCIDQRGGDYEKQFQSLHPPLSNFLTRRP